MNSFKSILAVTVIGLSCLSVNSQSLTMPAASPAASVSQTFGLTKIDIVYSSPGVKGRPIWGSLVPYDSVWRSGANSCTTIEFSTDVTVGGQKVKQGKYGFFTIPGKNSWTIILNSDAGQWGAYDYKKSLDVVRFTVNPMAGDMKERLAYMIDPVSDSSAMVSLCWEKIKVSFPVMAETKALTQKGFDAYLDKNGNLWQSYSRIASYDVDNGGDLNKALELANLSVKMKTGEYYNLYVLARVYNAMGDKKNTLMCAQLAKAAGDKKPGDESYMNNKAKVEKLIADNSGVVAPKK